MRAEWMALRVAVEAQDVVITGYSRTPFGRFGGSMRDLPLPTLGATAVTAAVQQSGLLPHDMDEVAMGVNFPGSDRSVARQVQLHAGIPENRVAFTVDRACCSSLTALNLAARGLRTGESAISVAGGVDNLSRVPYFVHAARWGNRIGPIVLDDQLAISCPYTGVARAVQAGQEAVAAGVSRENQDAWAVHSQQAYALALAEGHVSRELAPVRLQHVDGSSRTVSEDECPRPGTTLADLAELKTVYGSPTVTAGNAPNMSTGASALVLTTLREADRRGIAPIARLHGWSLVSGDPAHIASMPAKALTAALERTGLSLDAIDLIEINEAFAAVPLVTAHRLAAGDAGRMRQLLSETNVHGGAVAIGHPTGATAGRLVMSLVGALRARGGTTGAVTLCGGVGEAEAVIVELLETDPHEGSTALEHRQSHSGTTRCLGTSPPLRKVHAP